MSYTVIIISIVGIASLMGMIALVFMLDSKESQFEDRVTNILLHKKNQAAAFSELLADINMTAPKTSENRLARCLDRIRLRGMVEYHPWDLKAQTCQYIRLTPTYFSMLSERAHRR